MKVIAHCSKCFKNYPADLTMIFHWEDGDVFQYQTKCLNCGVNLECIVSEIEEVPRDQDITKFPLEYGSVNPSNHA